jgi:hypothetical protein
LYCLLKKKLENGEEFLHGGRGGAGVSSELGELPFVERQP